MNYSTKEAVRIIQNDGWIHIRTTGDHMQFKHSSKPGKVTIPANRKDLNIKTWNSIMRQAGLK